MLNSTHRILIDTAKHDALLTAIITSRHHNEISKLGILYVLHDGLRAASSYLFQTDGVIKTFKLD